MRHDSNLGMATLGMLLVLVSLPAGAADRQIVLDGVVTHADHRTYIEREFEVPDGIESITIDFRHDGKDDHTVIDLGPRDPEGFRGWTGSNKSRLEISAFDSTPGYRNGPVLKGRWALLLGVPNIRESVETHYRATVTLHQHYDVSASLLPGDKPLQTVARWYRGDLHMHTEHSDGYCLSQREESVPCPVHLTVEAGVAAGLDFVAVTD
ncbi:MAG TPA: hypothetical protein VE175_05915, partial [Woeseiaceae bacterium]|nr:hypothetical protein [Woeseiaceae bacterium]